MTRRLAPIPASLVRLVLASVVLCVAPLGAQVSITSPADGERLPAGLDFATELIGDPWDFSNRDDFSRRPGQNPGLDDLRIVGGRVTGTVLDQNAGITTLHRPHALKVNVGRTGEQYPIDTGRFSKVAFKVHSTVAGERPHVVWHHNAYSDGASQIGVLSSIGFTTAGSNIIVGDLTAPAASGREWDESAAAVSLRIDLNHTDQAGETMGLDWARLVPGDSSSEAVEKTVSWTGPAGSYTLVLQELGANAAAPLEIATVAGTTFDWSYGFLAPGSYRLLVEHSGGASDTVDFTVNDPPVIHVLDPDIAGGVDFATAVLGDPWDGDSTDDVALTKGVTSLTASGGVLVGEAVDPNRVYFLLDPKAGLDPLRYHRMTLRMKLDGEHEGFENGSFLRLAWSVDHAETTTLDLEPWNEWFTYHVVLDEIPPAKLRTPFEHWTTGEKRRFILDPHQATVSRTWRIDDLKIAADDEPVNGLFTVRWSTDDSDLRTAGAQVAPVAATVSLHYDTDTDPSSGLTLIASGLPATGSYVWDTSGLPAQRYWIRATTDDGVNSQARYSTGPLKNSNHYTLRILKDGTGQGTVTSAPGGIDCSNDCTHTFASGQVVNLTGTPADAESLFGGFSGDPDCADGAVTVTSDLTCVAAFPLVQYTLTIDTFGDGLGTVTSSPAGLDCRPSPRLPAVDEGIVLVDPALGGVTRLTRGANDSDPVMSPDGSRVSFWREDRLLVVRDDGRDLTPVARAAEGSARSVCWSPDGGGVALVDGDAAGAALRVFDVDGSARSGRSQLATDAVGASCAWLDDERILVVPEEGDMLSCGVSGGCRGATAAEEERLPGLRGWSQATVGPPSAGSRSAGSQSAELQSAGSQSAGLEAAPAGVCVAAFDSKTQVGLIVAPDPGSFFDGWVGGNLQDCSDGTVNLHTDKSCGVRFSRDPDEIFSDGFESGDVSRWTSAND